MRAKRFKTSGMVCPACPKVLERKLERIDGVASAEVDPRSGSTTVIYDAETVDDLSIAEAIYRAGFGVEVAFGGT